MMRRVVETWALDAVALADALTRVGSPGPAEHVRLAGGSLVLCGPGMYVNRLFGAGLDAPLTTVDFEMLESRADALGVDASIEITPLTHPDVRSRAEARGYVVARSIRAMSGTLADRDPLADDDAIVVEPAADRVDVWQEVSAVAWGRTALGERRAGDAFAAALASVAGAELLVATDVSSGEPVGCAGLTVRDEVATLLATATVPAARRRGVQARLIDHRLRLARAAGCRIVTSTVAPGSGSERNLVRSGLVPWFDITVLTRGTDARHG